MPIGKIYDHGDNFEKSNMKTQAVFEPYAALREKYPRSTVRSGDTIPIKDLEVDVVAAAGDSIEKPLPGAGQPNPLCSDYLALPPDPGEKAHSIAIIITFGNLRISDLGDLFWDKEYDLACPVNKLGTVDLYMTTHHGTATSGSAQMVHALRPKVAIMNNGEDKGGSIKRGRRLRTPPASKTFGNCIGRRKAGPNTTLPKSSSRIRP
jgi:competence protein ComEC